MALLWPEMAHVLLLAGAATIAVAASEDIFLQFYMDQVNLWNQQDQQAKLQSAVLAGLQDYCSSGANFATCGINSTSDATFTASAVAITAGYPVNSNSRYLDVRIGIEYTVGSTLVRLPAAVVAEIASKRREQVSSSVGYRLIYINRRFYSIPPPVLANKVIVPMFVLGTLLLIIVTLVLRQHQIREYHKRRSSSGSELKPNRKSATSDSAHANSDNKVGASATDLKAATGDSLGLQKRSDVVALDEQKSGKKQEKHKKKLKTKSKSKGKPGKTPGAAIDWSGGGNKTAGSGGNRNGTGEFNNIGFEKSQNEGDPRTRQSGASQSAAPQDQQQRAIGQSASNLSEIIQVRSGAASPMKGSDKGKKQKTRKRTGDAEEDTLMDNSVFKPPEGNLTDADRELTGSEDDGVPTLRDSSDQQMI